MTQRTSGLPPESAQALEWMRAGQSRFIDAVEGLSEDELRADSALPDWSRAHVAAHVARNAEAVGRLLSWARTGKETLMYPDGETRDRDIETAARQDPDALKADVRATAAAFDADIDTLPAESWSARVRTFQGRDVPASFAIWARTREVWLHLVDLGTGVAVESWPGDLVDALLDEVTATMSNRDDAPAWLLGATDRDRDWSVGAVGSAVDSGPGEMGPDVREISGKGADLLAWLTGRSAGEGLSTEGTLPAPPHWM